MSGMSDISSIQPGLCQCGCGQRTRIATRNDKGKNWIKGQHLKYSGRGHQGVRSQETIEKLRAASTGRKCSIETRAVLSLRQTGRRYSDAVRANMTAAARKHAATPAGRASLLRRAAIMWKTPKNREAVSRAGKLYWAKLNETERRAAILKRRCSLVDYLKKLSPEERASRMIKARVASQASPTSLERAVSQLLDALGVAYTHQYPIGPYVADLFVPSKKLVIECDGEYWHSRPGRREHDAKRDAHLVSIGYAVLRLLEADIKSGAAEATLSTATV